MFDAVECAILSATLQESDVPDVALAVLHNRSTDQVLLIRRSRGSGFAGWAFPGGKIEPLGTSSKKEDPVTAARRELAEETGIRIKKRGKEVFCRRHPTTGTVLRYVYFPVSASNILGIASNQEPQKAEDYAWCDLDKIDLMFHGGLSKGLIKELQRQIKNPRQRCELETPELRLGSIPHDR